MADGTTGGSELASPMGSLVSVSGSGDAVSACALSVATAFAAALRRFLVLAALLAVARRLRVLAALLAVPRPFRVFAAFFAAARRFRVTADFLVDDEAIYQLLCRRSASATLNRLTVPERTIFLNKHGQAIFRSSRFKPCTRAF